MGYKGWAGLWKKGGIDPEGDRDWSEEVLTVISHLASTGTHSFSFFFLSLFRSLALVLCLLPSRTAQTESFLSECPLMFDASRVSMATLSSDVQTLRKGIDLILYEREKQQNNFIIYSFYLNAVHKGAGGQGGKGGGGRVEGGEKRRVVRG